MKKDKNKDGIQNIIEVDISGFQTGDDGKPSRVQKIRIIDADKQWRMGSKARARFIQSADGSIYQEVRKKDREKYYHPESLNLDVFRPDEDALTISYYQSHGLDLSKARIHRTVFVRIYSSSFEMGIPFKKMVLNLLDSMELRIVFEDIPRYSSWFQKIIAKTKEPQTQAELEDIYKKSKKALELAQLDDRRADIGLKLAQTAHTLMQSVEDQDQVIAQIGPVLVIKFIDNNGNKKTLIKQLTLEQQEMLEENPSLTTNPQSLIDYLDKK